MTGNNPVAIHAAGISKVYRSNDSPLERIRRALIETPPSSNDIVALAPIDFTVRRGESVGLIGRNGSGKSTLLSIIAGVLSPTTGTIQTHGRVSALLELGSGFNPQFSGRENVYFNAMLHGLSRDEINSRFADIAEFAEIGVFMDRPVKTYSSGMFVRLAFAVAINLRPDILIVDEALSVGDIYFQQKCFERLREMREQGITLLFVSHNSGAVYRFCDRALLLEHGRLLLDDVPKAAIEAYEAKLITQRDEEYTTIATVSDDNLSKPVRPMVDVAARTIDREEVEVEHVEILDSTGESVHSLISEESITLRIKLRFQAGFEDPHVGFKIRNRFGDVVFETTTYAMRRNIGPVAAGEVVTVGFPFVAALHEGDYTLTLGIADGGFGDGNFRHQMAYRHDVAPFKVLRNYDSIAWSGFVNLFPECTIARSSSANLAPASEASESSM